MQADPKVISEQAEQWAFVADAIKWAAMVEAAQDIQKRIVESGGMANKSRVEDELMPMFGCDRYMAHQVMNHIEHHNLRKWGRR